MNDLVAKYPMRTGNNWGGGILLVNSEGQILVGLRTDTKTWCTPGGKVEVGETAEEGIRREVKEEVGLDILHLEFIDTHVGAFNNEKVWVSFLFTGRAKKGTPKPQLSEMSELRWVTKEELDKLELFPPTKVLIDKLTEQGVI